MTIKEKINADFLTAFKAKDMVKKTFLGFVKSEIQSLKYALRVFLNKCLG